MTSPYLVGWLKDLTHTNFAGLIMLSVVLVVGALVVLSVPKTLVDK